MSEETSLTDSWVRVHHREDVMGTVVTFDAYLMDSRRRDDIKLRFARAAQDLHYVDETFSTWKVNSPISRFRRGEISLGELPREILEVFDACTLAREASWGWFDPWAVPGGVDPTGYVKGWAAQRALAVIGEPEWLGGVIVNAAGDVCVHGSPGPNQSFRVGIVNPLLTSQLAFVVEVDAALATSGNYERGEHLIVPRTGEARSAVASASVTGPDLGLADALATALAVGGVDALGAVDDLEGYEGLLIGFDGVVSCTPGFPFAAHVGDDVQIDPDSPTT